MGERKPYAVDYRKLPPDYPTHAHPPEFWEALGRTVATFGFLEEALGKAIFAFTGMRQIPEENAEAEYRKWLPTLEKALTDALGSLIDSYGKAVRPHEGTTIGNLEVAKSSDLLGQWLRLTDVKKAIILSEATNGATVANVIAQGYAPDLNDVETEKIGRDPFLVAAALGGAGRIVVTRERSSPAKQRANRKVPDFCAAFGVAWFNDFDLWRVLDFRIE